MISCPECREPNDEHNKFCRKCASRLPPAGEMGRAAHSPQPQAPQAPQANPYAPQPAPGKRCAQCGSTHSLQAAVGPSLVVRVFSAGRQDDVPLGPASVCVDCGAVSLAIPEDARAYLAGAARR